MTSCLSLTHSVLVFGVYMFSFYLSVEILRNAVSELRREIQRQSDKNERRKCMVDVWNEVAKPALGECSPLS